MDLERLVQSTFNEHRESVVVVEKRVTDPKDGGMAGTGFIIRSTSTSCLVMTCYHVVKGFVPSKHALCIRFAGKATEYGAEILHEHQRADLAIIRVRGTNGKYPALHFGSSEDVPPRTTVCLLGYIFTGLNASTLDPAVSPGKTSAMPKHIGAGIADVVFTSPSKAGGSGSPVMLGDKVIGVLFGSLWQVLHARSSETVNAILKDWLGIASDATRSTEEMIDLLEI